MRTSTFSGVMMARHRGAVMTRYKTPTEIQLEKLNATVNKLLAAQLETNRLLQAYFAPVAHDPAPARAVLMRSLYDRWPYGPQPLRMGLDDGEGTKTPNTAPNDAGHQIDAIGPAGGQDNANAGNSAAAEWAQITLDDLLAAAGAEPDPDVWADLGYGGTN